MSDSEEGGDTESQPATGFDRYRSLLDPTLTVLVPTDEVPPFRFRAGGWELLQSSVEVGAAIEARIADKGFFLFRVNEDLSGGVELPNRQPHCRPTRSERRDMSRDQSAKTNPAPRLKTSKSTWYVSFEPKERPSGQRGAPNRKTETFRDETEAKAFAKAKQADKLNINAGTINPYQPKRIVTSVQISGWLNEPDVD
jgi:hypothetical protein